MDSFQKIYSEAAPVTFADFQKLAKKIQPEAFPEFKKFKKLKIGYLSSFTTKGLKEVLTVQCLQAGILPEIYTGDYNQYTQEILDPQSGLHAFKPQVIILFVDLQTILGDSFFRPYELNPVARELRFEGAVTGLQALIDKLKKDFSGTILVHDFEMPVYSPYGILENKQENGFFELIEKLNSRLRAETRKDDRVFIFPYDTFCSRMGKDRLADPKMVYMGDMKLDVNHMPALCRNYMAYLKPLAGLSKKCLVLDMDNTLWGGILGEDGFDGIHLGPTPQGRPYWEFQQYILSLFQRGVILAVNSRNNPEDVFKVLREHPYMVLKEKHFAAIQINWNDKASNLKTIAKNINIGLDSLVFFDDDKMNRGLVQVSLPEVHTVDVPEDPTLYPQTLKNLDDFNILQLTDEDRSRGEAYASERLREDHKREIKIEDYLKSLHMVMVVEPVSSFTLPRIAQLTQKTNQFNMTTRRYSEADIKRFSDDPQYGIWSFRLSDNFGDSGIIAVLITEKQKEALRVDTFLMSCRVLGRKVEDAIFSFLQHQAADQGKKTILGEFFVTEKNAPAKTFYSDRKFQLKKDQDGHQIWHYEVATPLPYPEEIKMEIKNK